MLGGKEHIRSVTILRFWYCWLRQTENPPLGVSAARNESEENILPRNDDFANVRSPSLPHAVRRKQRHSGMGNNSSEQMRAPRAALYPTEKSELDEVALVV